MATIFHFAKTFYYQRKLSPNCKKKKELILTDIYSLEIPFECSVELSPLGYQFFAELFQTFDKDKDGALNRIELDSLFSTSPGNPWANSGFPHTTITTETGSVTLQGWLAQWSMTTLLDHRTTLKYLAYLGFEGDTRTALKVTKPKRVDRKKGKIQRNVFSCYVFGAPGSGKVTKVYMCVQSGKLIQTLIDFLVESICSKTIL